jgi:hypothetical protein
MRTQISSCSICCSVSIDGRCRPSPSKLRLRPASASQQHACQRGGAERPKSQEACRQKLSHDDAHTSKQLMGRCDDSGRFVPLASQGVTLSIRAVKLSVTVSGVHSMQHPPRQCSGCGKPWSPKRRHAQTCGHRCRQRLYRRRRAERRAADSP